MTFVISPRDVSHFQLFSQLLIASMQMFTNSPQKFKKQFNNLEMNNKNQKPQRKIASSFIILMEQKRIHGVALFMVFLNPLEILNPLRKSFNRCLQRFPSDKIKTFEQEKKQLLLGQLEDQLGYAQMTEGSMVTQGQRPFTVKGHLRPKVAAASEGHPNTR